MPDDDEIIDAYEREVAGGGAPQVRRSNRGFWLVTGTIGLASIFLTVEIFANRSIADSIAHAQYDLRVAQAAAERIRVETGTFAAADAGGLNELRLDGGQLSAVGADEPSSGLAEVSVFTDGQTWAAAVSARPNACFYLKLVGNETAAYGAGTLCTGRAALAADDTRW